MNLSLTIPRVYTDDIQRGLQAAAAVFREARVNPFYAAESKRAEMNWDMAGFPEDGSFAMTEQEGREAEIWDMATQAAIDAACPTWSEGQKNALDQPLQVILTEEEKAEYFNDDEPEEDVVLPPEAEAAWQEERAKFRHNNPPEIEFAAAEVIRASEEAPKTGKWFVGQDRSGRLAHVRWQKDMEEGGTWRRLDTNESIDLIAWAPSHWEREDIEKAYANVR